MYLSIRLYVYLVELVTKYYSEKKKEHIYAYRRRESIRRHIDRLEIILEHLNRKDLELLDRRLDALRFNIFDRLGYFDELNLKLETEIDRLERRIEEKKSFLADPIAYYVCPNCKEKGYLCSPNLDEHKLDLYMLHIDWNEKTMNFCHLGKTRENLLLILTPPVEGILQFH